MLLLTVVSLFEGWSDAIGTEVGLSKINREALQWPSHAKYPRYNKVGNAIPGITEALQAGLTSSSAIIKHASTQLFGRTGTIAGLRSMIS